MTGVSITVLSAVVSEGRDCFCGSECWVKIAFFSSDFRTTSLSLFSKIMKAIKPRQAHGRKILSKKFLDLNFRFAEFMLGADLGII
jgi:hypothetical protein